MKARWFSGLAATAVVAAFTFTADAKLASAPGENSAKFNAQGPAGLSINGQTAGVTVSDDGANVTVSVPLKDLDTGIALRNRHMREKYLEVDKYPAAVLVLPRAQIQFPAAGATASGSAAGQMTIHGQTKPVTVSYSAKNDGGTYRVQGTAPLNINDFGIQVPSYLGVTVKPGITVEVRFAAVDKP